MPCRQRSSCASSGPPGSAPGAAHHHGLPQRGQVPGVGGQLLQHAVPHGRVGDRERGPLPLGHLGERRGLVVGAGQQQRGAAGERGVGEPPGQHPGHRHDGQHQIVLADAVRLRGLRLEGVQIEGAVAVGDAARCGAVPGHGVAEHRRVALVDRGPVVVAAPVGDQLLVVVDLGAVGGAAADDGRGVAAAGDDHVPQVAEPGQHGGQRREPRRVGDQHPCVAAHRGGDELVGGQPRVEGVQDGAHRGHGQIRLQMVGGVGHQRGDGVPGRDPEVVVQGGGELDGADARVEERAAVGLGTTRGPRPGGHPGGPVRERAVHEESVHGQRDVLHGCFAHRPPRASSHSGRAAVPAPVGGVPVGGTGRRAVRRTRAAPATRRSSGLRGLLLRGRRPRSVPAWGSAGRTVGGSVRPPLLILARRERGVSGPERSGAAAPGTGGPDGYGPGGPAARVRSGRAAPAGARAGGGSTAAARGEAGDGHIRHAAGRMPRGDGPVRRGGVGGGRRAGRAARPRGARWSARLRRRVPGAGSRRARARYAGRRCQSPVPPPRHREDGPSRIAVDCRRASTLIESPPGDRNGSARAAAGQHAEPSAPGCPLLGPGPGPGKKGSPARRPVATIPGLPPRRPSRREAPAARKPVGLTRGPVPGSVSADPRVVRADLSVRTPVPACRARASCLLRSRPGRAPVGPRGPATCCPACGSRAPVLLGGRPMNDRSAPGPGPGAVPDAGDVPDAVAGTGPGDRPPGGGPASGGPLARERAHLAASRAARCVPCGPTPRRSTSAT